MRLRGLLLFAALPLAAFGNSSGDVLRRQIAEAAPGAVLNVPAGDYAGPFVIEKPLHLLGAPGAILRGDGTGNVVTIRAADVELAGFLVRGSGRSLSDDNAAIHISGARAVIRDNRVLDMLHGIYVRKADGCRILRNVVLGDGASRDAIDDPLRSGLNPADAASGEFCAEPLSQDRRGNGIHLWNSSGHLIEGNIIRGTRDGVYFSFTKKTVVRGNRVERVRYGLHYMYSDDNEFDGNTFTENAAGAALMFSKRLVLRGNRFVSNRSQRAYGLLLQAIDDTSIESNRIEGNTLGLYVENSNNLSISRNRVAGNYVGLRLSDSTQGARIFENDFSGNIHPIDTSGTNSANVWAVAGRGNHWDGEVALDLNRDGIADVPHHEPDLFGGWRRSFPAIGLLSASPGEQLVRFVHRRIALPGIPGVTDPRPLIRGHEAAR